MAACAPSTKTGSIFRRNRASWSATTCCRSTTPTGPARPKPSSGLARWAPPNPALVTLKARFGQAEATNYVPYGAAGNATSTSSYFGGTLGGQNGPLQLSESANQDRECDARNLGGERALSVGAARANRADLWRRDPAPQHGVARARHVAAFGRVSAGRALDAAKPELLSTPAGQSQIRMISLPGFPVKTDEAAAL